MQLLLGAAAGGPRAIADPSGRPTDPEKIAVVVAPADWESYPRELPEALRILRDIPGLTVDAEPRLGDHRPDAILRFADRQATVAVEIKQRANAATAWQLVHYAELYPDTPMMLIAGETTADARQILRE